MRIHLIGICGTGMGSLAGLLTEAGHEVRGSDENVYPPMSTMLRSKGIVVLEGYRAANLDPRPELVVVGNIASAANPEAKAVVELGLEYVSMPQALARFFLSKRHSIVVAGTHGKTTTTAMIARMLLDAGRDPSFLVGGVLQDLDRSYRLGGGDTFVIEGDEYETAYFDKGPKFLHYLPRTAILTSVEYDHAEMFDSLEAVKAAFARLVALVPAAGSDGAAGALIVCADDPLALGLSGACRGEVITYGIEASARYVGRALETSHEGQSFRASEAGSDLGVFNLRMAGRHNLRNALAAVAVGRRLGLSVDSIRSGLDAFAGVRRRQEVRGVVGGVTLIDDFAHHPTAVRETIAAMRSRFAGQRLWALFEPRTNTTRRDVFQQEYARAFDGAHEVLVAPVDHPERAPEGRRFDVGRLIDDLSARGVSARYAPGGVQEIVSLVVEEAHRGDVLLVMSNGGFGGIHEKLLAALSSRAAAGATDTTGAPI